MAHSFYCVTKVLVLLLVVLLAMGARDQDLVRSFPGFEGNLPTRHWSGYIPVPLPEHGSMAHVHYWLVENDAKDETAPTVVWQQGGPGGSSLIGFLTEMGPFTLNDFSFSTEAYLESGIPTVFTNHWSWHTAPANFLFVEHPAPTGFSYCEGKCDWDDTKQAEANYAFYVHFFKEFPELAKNDFFISGESYAGVLVPTLALKILEHRTKENKEIAPWSLKGFALGNDCPGNRVYTCTPYSGWAGTQVSLDFMYGHGMIKEQTYQKINKECEGYFGTYHPPPQPCRSLLEDPIRPVLSEAGDSYDMGGGYFLYDTCSADLITRGPDGLPVKSGNLTHPLATQRNKRIAEAWVRVNNPNQDFPLNDGEYACGQERASTVWLNLPSVQEALHVKLVGKESFDFFTPLNYSFTAHSLLDEYNSKLIPNFRVLQYSGDADPCVPYVGTERWISSLGLEVDEGWRPWQAPNTMPVTGYVVTYTANNFTFATLRDAGHMVPRYKPRQAFYMFKQWLNNRKL